MSRAANIPTDWEAVSAETGVEVRSATLLGEGWSGRVYRVNQELTFKFPKRALEWDEIDREIGFLTHAAASLPLPVPEHLHQFRTSEAAPHGYAVYRHIVGRGAEAAVSVGFDRRLLAAVLGRFLRALHALEITPELAGILPREDEREAAAEYRELAGQRVVPGLAASEAARLRREFDDYLEDRANFPADPRIIHADLKAGHVLCDGASLTGVLDWGDACLGDPDYDFSYLYGDFGEAFVRELASHYGHPDPDRLIRKARYYWIVDQIDTITCSNGRAPSTDVDAAHQRMHELLTG